MGGWDLMIRWNCVDDGNVLDLGFNGKMTLMVIIIIIQVIYILFISPTFRLNCNHTLSQLKFFLSISLIIKIKKINY